MDPQQHRTALLLTGPGDLLGSSGDMVCAGEKGCIRSFDSSNTYSNVSMCMYVSIFMQHGLTHRCLTAEQSLNHRLSVGCYQPPSLDLRHQQEPGCWDQDTRTCTLLPRWHHAAPLAGGKVAALTGSCIYEASQ